MVVPFSFKRCRTANTSCTSLGASPMEGSSRMRILASLIRARAKASICCSPPLRVPASCPARSRRRGKISITISRSRARPALSRRIQAPSCKFSITVSPPKMPRPSGTWERPRWRMRSGVIPHTSRPSRMTEPSKGSMPEIARRVVVLPAPLAPTRARISPCCTWKLMSLTARISP